MKILSILLFTIFFISCENVPKEDPAKTVINSDFAKQHAAETKAPNEGFVPENNACICTKEYNPVCGSNSRTYPSPCQAGCDGIKKYTQGPCK